MKRMLVVPATVLAVMVLALSAMGRNAEKVGREQVNSTALAPAYCNVAHNVGKIGLSVSNDGTFGASLSVSGSGLDCFTGEALPTGEFPLGSRTMYLFGGALWIGAVVGTDTLVSTGADGWSRPGHEFHPDEPPVGNIIYRSTTDPAAPQYAGAVSEQDYIAVYGDTCTNCTGAGMDPLDGRYHIPLHLEVTQTSFAWSLPHAEDFVLVDYSIKNIGVQFLDELYLGIYADCDVYSMVLDFTGAQDDISGLWSGTHPVTPGSGCEIPVDLDVAWAADNDGDLNQSWYPRVLDVTGIRLLRCGSAQTPASFNWFVSNGNASLDFGPMSRDNARNFTTGGLGTPEGDRNKYYLLSNGERDYDQVRVATIGADDPVWLPPPAEWAPYWAMGLDTRYVLSVGPFSLEPGQTVPLTFAYVGGEGLHSGYANFLNLPDDPDTYLGNLDFSDLVTNAVWAGWVFDNPGVDTDSDGYAGEYQVCGDDTAWYRGDGVPDWRATTEPVAPTFWVEPRPAALYVRWNGLGSETSIDWATRENEFEGYRAYLSASGSPSDFARVASYDIEDFRRYHWDAAVLDWVLNPSRFTLEQAVCLYAPGGCADPSWHPSDYTRQAPYVMPGHPDSMFYFEPILANASRLGLETPFVKRYPAASRPGYDRPGDVPVDSADVYLTPDGYFKYYEYEFVIADLLPKYEYWVTMTAFESSSMIPESIPLESPVVTGAKSATTLPYQACCQGTVGNTNCDLDDRISLADVAVLIDYLYITGRPLCCIEEADINQSGGADPAPNDITLGDVSLLIDYLFITGPDNMALPVCF
jgi:hypothetical protein